MVRNKLKLPVFCNGNVRLHAWPSSSQFLFAALFFSCPLFWALVRPVPRQEVRLLPFSWSRYWTWAFSPIAISRIDCPPPPLTRACSEYPLRWVDEMSSRRFFFSSLTLGSHLPEKYRSPPLGIDQPRVRFMSHRFSCFPFVFFFNHRVRAVPVL